MKTIPALTIAAGLLTGLAIGSMEADSHACSIAIAKHRWTLELLEVSIEGDDTELLEIETDRWADATRLDFDTQDNTHAFIRTVLVDTDYGESAATLHFYQIANQSGE